MHHKLDRKITQVQDFQGSLSKSTRKKKKKKCCMKMTKKMKEKKMERMKMMRIIILFSGKVTRNI